MNEIVFGRGSLLDSTDESSKVIGFSMEPPIEDLSVTFQWISGEELAADGTASGFLLSSDFGGALRILFRFLTIIRVAA